MISEVAPIGGVEKGSQQKVELSVVAPQNELTISCELPNAASSLEQAEWRASLQRVVAWLTEPSAFLQPRTHVTEIPNQKNTDGWAEALTGTLLPDSSDFLQHGLAQNVREAIASQIQELATEGGNLELDLGTIPTLTATEKTDAVALADWLVLKHTAELQNNLAPFTGAQAEQIKIHGTITVADWTEAPLRGESNSPTATTKAQQLKQIWQNLKSEQKPDQQCDISITTETAMFQNDAERETAEAAAEKLSMQLQALWDLSETVFVEAFTHLQTNATDWIAFAAAIHEQNKGPQISGTTDTDNDYKKLIQAIIDENAALKELLSTLPHTELFGAMTPVWKAAFKTRIAALTKQPIDSPTLIATGLHYLARQCVLRQLKTAKQPKAIRYNWVPSLKDAELSQPTDMPSIPLRIFGKLSKQECDPAMADFTIVDPRKPILTKPEKTLIEKAAGLQAKTITLSPSDSETLARQLAALVLKQQTITPLIVRSENLDPNKTVSTTTVRIAPKNSSVSIGMPMALQ